MFKKFAIIFTLSGILMFSVAAYADQCSNKCIGKGYQGERYQRCYKACQRWNKAREVGAKIKATTKRVWNAAKQRWEEVRDAK